MPLLHDPTVRASIEARLNALRSDATRRWGRMTVDQMLWHVNQFLAAALGEISLPEQKIAMPPFLLRFILLRMPWPKSAPTNSGAIASRAYDFAVEHHRCRELIDRLVRRPLEGEWNVNPVLGAVNGRFVSALQAKHLDHHLRQFGV